MTWVKVCGVRRPQDVEAAAEAGADAIGLVLTEASPRFVPVETAAALAAGSPLPAFVLTVDAAPEVLLDLAVGVGAAGVQPYGRHAAEAAAAAEAAGLEVLRPAAVDGPVTVEHIPVGQIPLLDAHVPGLLGGTGVGFDPALVPALDRRWVMAGGLGPDNVAAAIRRLRPWGVDASSRLEAAPGRKDPDLIRRFVEEAKTA